MVSGQFASKSILMFAAFSDNLCLFKRHGVVGSRFRVKCSADVWM